MSGKVSVATVGTIGIAALVVGFIFRTLVPAQTLFGAHKKAVIVMDGNNACSQYEIKNGTRIKTAYPVLNPPVLLIFGGDKIMWHGEDAKGNPAKVVVHFSTTPFAANQYDDGMETSDVDNSPRGDYPFDTVTVGTTPCSSFRDPGIHVDQ